MAFTPLSKDMNIIAALPDEPNTAGYSAAQLKAKFDEGIIAIKNFLNSTLIAELSSSSGAGNIGIDDIADLDAQTVQEALEEIKDMIGSYPGFPLSVVNGGTGATTAEAARTSLGAAGIDALTALSGAFTEHTGAENPHSITPALIGVSEEGKLLLTDIRIPEGETEPVEPTETTYSLQIGKAEDAAAGYITFVLES